MITLFGCTHFFNFVSFLLYPMEVKMLRCAMLGAFTLNIKFILVLNGIGKKSQAWYFYMLEPCFSISCLFLQPLSKEEESLALNTRKLWSAHLLPLHGALANIIRTFASSSCQPLQQVLRKVGWQLSDLAAPTATMVTR